jgi:membrane protein
MLPSDSEVSATFGVLGLLIVLLSATSFSRALTRMYAKAWTVRPPGWAGGWRWIAAIVAIAGATVGLQTVDAALGDARSGVVGVLLLTWLVHSFLWTWVPWLLLGARVPWLLLAPGGVMMGVAAVVMSVVGRIYLPPALEHASDRFGDLGVAFAYIGWLFAFAFVLIVATLLGMVLARAPGPFSRMLERRTGPWTGDPEPVAGSLIRYE